MPIMRGVVGNTCIYIEALRIVDFRVIKKVPCVQVDVIHKGTPTQDVTEWVYFKVLSEIATHCFTQRDHQIT